MPIFEISFVPPGEVKWRNTRRGGIIQIPRRVRGVMGNALGHVREGRVLGFKFEGDSENNLVAEARALRAELHDLAAVSGMPVVTHLERRDGIRLMVAKRD